MAGDKVFCVGNVSWGKEPMKVVECFVAHYRVYHPRLGYGGFAEKDIVLATPKLIRESKEFNWASKQLSKQLESLERKFERRKLAAKGKSK